MFSYIIQLTMTLLSNRAMIFVDSVPQREAMHHGEKKIELQMRRPRFQFLIFLILMFSHITQPLGFLHFDSMWWIWVGKYPPHDSGWKEWPKRVMMGVPGMCKWENHYQPTLQTGSDSSHQKSLRSLCHNCKTRIWVPSENRAFEWAYWIEVLERNQLIHWLTSTQRRYFDHM